MSGACLAWSAARGLLVKGFDYICRTAGLVSLLVAGICEKCSEWCWFSIPCGLGVLGREEAEEGGIYVFALPNPLTQ